jgi:hypothetical protein
MYLSREFALPLFFFPFPLSPLRGFIVYYGVLMIYITIIDKDDG